MKPRYLEDIVKEDERKLTLLDKVRENMRGGFDMPIANHPILTSLAVFEGIKSLPISYPSYFENRLEHLSFSGLAAYVVYLGLDLVKQYIVELRSKRKTGEILWYKRAYYWMLDNPKMPTIMAASLGAIITANESDDPRQIVANFLHAGIFTEVAVRSLRNLTRIKKSIRSSISKEEKRGRTISRTIENLYNEILIHPFLLTGLTFFSYFSNEYQKRIASGKLTGNFLDDVVNNTGQLASAITRTGFEDTVSLGCAMVAGSVLHTHSLREFGLRLTKTFYTVIGNREKAKDVQRRIVDLPNSTERNIEDIVELGNLCYRLAGDAEDSKKEEYRTGAFRHYRKAMRIFSKKSDQISYADIFRGVCGIGTLKKSARWLSRRVYGLFGRDEGEETINDVFRGLLNNDQEALERIKQLAEKEQSPELIYLYGKALEVFGYKESGRKQKRKAVEILKPDLALDRMPSKNLVFVLNHPLLKRELIGKHLDHEKLERERFALEEADRITREFEKYSVPMSLGVVDIKGLEYHVMEFNHGTSLEDKIKGLQPGFSIPEDLERTLLDVSDYMALLHARIKLNLEERDHEQAIRRKLEDCNVDEYTKDLIQNNIYPLIDNLRTMPLVYHKDCHPANWIIGEDNDIAAIDFEAQHSARLPIDIAKLLNRDLTITEMDKIKILNNYVRSFEKYSGTRLPSGNQVYLAYLNAVIITALEAYSTGVESKKSTVVNAMGGIQLIRQEYPEYYIRHRTNYDSLETALERLTLLA